jgi:hypothetical protein
MGVFQVKTEFNYQKDQVAAFQIGLHHLETRAIVKHTDTNAGRFASCRRHHQSVSKARSAYFASPRLLDTESE